MPLFPSLVRAQGVWRPQRIDELDAEMDAAIGGRPTTAGVMVDEQTAMTYSAVYACIRVRAEALAQLSLHLYRRKGRGAERATDHPLYYLVHDQPNPEMTSVQWRKTASFHYDGWGNAYAWLDIPKRGRKAGYIQQIYPLKPHRVRPFREAGTNRLKYEYTVRHEDGTTEKRIFDRDEILHVPGLGYDGIMGYSPIMLARQAIGLALATEEFGARFFGQGTHVGGIVSYPSAITENQVDAVREKLKKDYAGLAQSHGLMVLAAGGQYTPINMPLEDAQFLAIRKFQLEEIARMYRVPLHLIQNLDKATFSNIEQQALEFAMYTMAPYCKEWEQALNARLLTEEERQAGYYFEFDLNSLMRGDAKSRAEFYKIMREVGAYSPNTILQKENENPREDPGGDQYWDQGPSGQRSNETQEPPTAPPVSPPPPSLRARMQPVLADVMARIAKRERQDILREAAKRARRGDEAGFQAWLTSWMADHKAFCEHALTPYYTVLGQPNEAEIAAERRINALKAALFGLKSEDIEAIAAALEGISA